MDLNYRPDVVDIQAWIRSRNIALGIRYFKAIDEYQIRARWRGRTFMVKSEDLAVGIGRLVNIISDIIDGNEPSTDTE